MIWTGLLPTPRAMDGGEGCHGLTWSNTDINLHNVIEGKGKQPLISSPAACPASPHPVQVNAKVKKMPDGSGRKLLRSWMQLNRTGSSLRIQLVSLLLTAEWNTSRCWHTWKLKAIGPRVLLYLQARLERRTAGIEYGLLQSPMPSDVDGGRTTKGSKRPGETGIRGQLLCTPKASPSGPDFARMGRPGSGGNDLVTQIAMIPTQDARCWKSGVGRKENGHTQQLEAVMAMLPTATAQDSSGHAGNYPKTKTHHEGTTLATAIRQSGTNTGMKLQPGFVEWMMGYPVGWTELEKYPPNPRTKARPPGESIG